MKRQFSVKKWIKLYLPGLSMGLFAFSVSESHVLNSLYSLRGFREVSPELFVVKVESGYTPLEVLERIPGASRYQCFNFHPQAVEGADCTDVNVANWPLEENYRRLLGQFRESLNVEGGDGYGNERIWYHGPLQMFAPVPSTVAMAADYFIGDEKKILVLIPDDDDLSVSVITPVGLLKPYEIALNALSNVKEGVTLKGTPALLRILYVAFAVFLTNWLLLQYPIFLALVLSILSFLFVYVVALVGFDYFHVALPVISVGLAILLTAMMVMVNRLNSSQKGEWNLERDKENLLRLEEMRTNFLSLVSHDLKTPIARMQSVLEQILRGDFGILSEDQKRAILRVLSANGYLQRTISSFLLLNRVESGHFSLRREPTDLVELINSVIGQMQPQIQERGIDLKFDFEPLFLVELDKGLMREVLINILDNAIKYTPLQAQIEISCGESENCPDLIPPQPGVWFEIRDFGPGIPAEDRKQIAQKFFRGKQEVNEGRQASKGTGIGLFLSAFFVEKHGGRLSFYSKNAGEILQESDVASQYFSEAESGTVMRVALPVENRMDLT